MRNPGVRPFFIPCRASCVSRACGAEVVGVCLVVLRAAVADRGVISSQVKLFVHDIVHVFGRGGHLVGDAAELM